jgi:hypothetical protein
VAAVTPPIDLARTRFAGTGEMRERVRELDWASTPLGPVEGWPATLVTIVDVMLGSAFPQILLWGPDLVQIYNDAYRPLIGMKHPSALGQPIRDCWPELWEISRPQFERVLAGETMFLQDVPFDLTRSAETERTYFTASQSPVRGDDGVVAGILATMMETTSGVRGAEIQGERERLLRELQVERARLEEVFRQAPTFLAILHGPDHVFHLANDAYYQVVGHRKLLGRRVVDALPEVVAQGFVGILDEVLRTGTRSSGASCRSCCSEPRAPSSSSASWTSSINRSSTVTAPGPASSRTAPTSRIRCWPGGRWSG